MRGTANRKYKKRTPPSKQISETIGQEENAGCKPHFPDGSGATQVIDGLVQMEFTSETTLPELGLVRMRVHLIRPTIHHGWTCRAAYLIEIVEFALDELPF